MDPHNIQAVYPLTSLQEGMLFHGIREPESTAHISQHSTTLRGPSSLPLFLE